MPVTLNLPPETERRLREKAARSGQTLEGYLEALAREAAAPAALSPEEWAAQFRAWVASHQRLPALADDSRESIYEGRGE
jgi:plasmid stability protein